MKPRITIAMTESGTLDIMLNEQGRSLLIEELQRLDRSNDHFHLDAPECATDIELRTTAHRSTDKVIVTAKVCLRPDDWDREYFPHVLQD